MRSAGTPTTARHRSAASSSDRWTVTHSRSGSRPSVLVTNSQRPSGMPVSQNLSTALLMRQRPEQSIRRDFQRLFVACELERRYSDTQMLRAWLSTAYFGVEPFGIENAAHVIFGKSVADLNSDESARLTALLHAPTLRRNPDRWTARARIIAERASAKPNDP